MRSGSCDAAVVPADVGEGGAVLGDVDRRRRVVLVHADEEVVEAVGVDLPAHGGVRASCGVHADRPPPSASARTIWRV